MFGSLLLPECRFPPYSALSFPTSSLSGMQVGRRDPFTGTIKGQPHGERAQVVDRVHTRARREKNHKGSQLIQKGLRFHLEPQVTYSKSLSQVGSGRAAGSEQWDIVLCGRRPGWPL